MKADLLREPYCGHGFHGYFGMEEDGAGLQLGETGLALLILEERRIDDDSVDVLLEYGSHPGIGNDVGMVRQRDTSGLQERFIIPATMGGTDKLRLSVERVRPDASPYGQNKFVRGTQQ